MSKSSSTLAPEVSRILLVRNLPFGITSEELYDLFGKYGAIYQIRLGNTKESRGTAFVVYEDIYDSKNAYDHLNGFNVQGRYLIVIYYQSSKQVKRLDLEKKRTELEALKAKYNITDE